MEAVRVFFGIMPPLWGLGCFYLRRVNNFCVLKLLFFLIGPINPRCHITLSKVSFLASQRGCYFKTDSTNCFFFFLFFLFGWKYESRVLQDVSCCRRRTVEAGVRVGERSFKGRGDGP